jgi:tetratricopeptide (TPR) repeat protein
MRPWIRPLTLTLALLVAAPAAQPAPRDLRGAVLLEGADGETEPAPNLDVTLRNTGLSVATDVHGVFLLPLPDALGGGDPITLLVDKPDWVIHHPLEGEARVPADLLRQTVEIRLLPKGWKGLLTHERLARLIADVADQAKEEVRLGGSPQEIDFSRYLKDWATRYGFGLEQVQTEIDRWVVEVERNQQDLYELGLAAYAKKNFAEAFRLGLEAGEAGARRLERIRKKERDEVEKTVRNFRLAGDAAYADYAFAKALDAYRRALGVLVREEAPELRAATLMDVAKAHYQLGIRVGGAEAQAHLAEAVAAYRQALEVRTFEDLAPQWLQTQTNLYGAYEALEDAAGMAGVLEALLRAAPDNQDIYNAAQALYHETLFDFESARRLTGHWLERHPDDLDAQCNYAETHFTTGRFDDAATRLAALTDGGRLQPETEPAMRLLEIANLLALGKADAAAARLDALAALVEAEPEDFKVGWTFAGTAHFIAEAPALADHREMLLALLQAAETGGRDPLLAAIASAGTSLSGKR